MHPITYQFLTAEHIRTLQQEAEAGRLAAPADRPARNRTRFGHPGIRIRFGMIRRLAARLGTG